MYKINYSMLLLLLVLGLLVSIGVSCSDGGGDGFHFDSDDDNDDSNDDDYDDEDYTWTDPNTGMTWHFGGNDPEISDHFWTWHEANEYCENVIWAGYNDWRLPTISELRTLIRGCPFTETGGPCGVTDECYWWSCLDYRFCPGCPLLEGPNDGRYAVSGCGDYCYWQTWSSTTYNDTAWFVNFCDASIYWLELSDKGEIFCVRR